MGDINRDGRQDLALSNFGDTTVAVLLGNGDGTFQAVRTVPAGGSNPHGVAIGDVNGDGSPDLAAANYVGNSVSVIRGNGDGTFQPAVIVRKAAVLHASR